MIPRIQGRVGQIEDPPEWKGKWCFEIFISFLGGERTKEQFGPFGPFETEEIAHKELGIACKLCCEQAELAIDGKVSGKYIDMKTNLTRPWDKSDEQ